MSEPAVQIELINSLIRPFTDVGVRGLEPLNPKELSYSQPQLPLCDTPNYVVPTPFARNLPIPIRGPEPLFLELELQN